METKYRIYLVDLVTGESELKERVQMNEPQIIRHLTNLQYGYCEDEHPRTRVRDNGDVVSTCHADFAYAARPFDN